MVFAIERLTKFIAEGPDHKLRHRSQHLSEALPSLALVNGRPVGNRGVPRRWLRWLDVESPPVRLALAHARGTQVTSRQGCAARGRVTEFPHRNVSQSLNAERRKLTREVALLRG